MTVRQLPIVAYAGGSSASSYERASSNGGVNAVNIVVIVQRVEKIDRFLSLRFGQFDKILGEVSQLGGGCLPAGSGDEFGNGVQVFDFADETGAGMALRNFLGFERFDILCSGFNGVGFRIARPIGVCCLDHAHVIEEEADAAGIAERAGPEQMADYRCGTIAVVGQALDDDGNLMGRETFVGDELVGHLFIGLAGTFLDGAFDRIARDRSFPSRFHGRVQPGVEVGVRSAEFGSDEDFTDQFADDLAAFHGVGHAAGLFPSRAHADGVLTAGAKCNCQPIVEPDWTKGKGIEPSSRSDNVPSMRVFRRQATVIDLLLSALSGRSAGLVVEDVRQTLLEVASNLKQPSPSQGNRSAGEWVSEVSRTRRSATGLLR